MAEEIWQPRRQPDEEDGQGPVPAHLLPARDTTKRRRGYRDSVRRVRRANHVTLDGTWFAAPDDLGDDEPPTDEEDEEMATELEDLREPLCTDANADGTPCGRPPWTDSAARRCYSHEMRARRAAEREAARAADAGGATGEETREGPAGAAPPALRPARVPGLDADAAAATIRRRPSAAAAAIRRRSAPMPAAAPAGTPGTDPDPQRHLRAYVEELRARRERIDRAIGRLQEALAILDGTTPEAP